MSTALTTLTDKLAKTLGMGQDGSELLPVLKATAFKGNVNDAQMTALMVVANQYGLNPWTKEIYAFPDKNNGIVPVVGVDGWSRIINSHPQFDGMEFAQDDKSCTCIIYRKDRSRPVSVTEFMDECKRPTGPWQSHPKRMLRHKAMIQAARLAFSYVGIYDQDEAERIVEAVGQAPSGKASPPASLPAIDGEAWAKFAAMCIKGFRTGKTLDAAIAFGAAKYTLSQSQKDEMKALHDQHAPIDVMGADEETNEQNQG